MLSKMHDSAFSFQISDALVLSVSFHHGYLLSMGEMPRRAGVNPSPKAHLCFLRDIFLGLDHQVWPISVCSFFVSLLH